MTPALVLIVIVITVQKKKILTAWLVDVSGACRPVKPVEQVSGAHTYVVFLCYNNNLYSNFRKLDRKRKKKGGKNKRN